MQYRPLPEDVTIKESPIEGLGLFAVKHIYGYTDLGVSHVLYIPFMTAGTNTHKRKTIVRTALGGHINHSDTPNCSIERSDNTNMRHLLSITAIKEGEELTVSYGEIPLEGFSHI